jgi:hypothetical protein
MKKNVGGIDKTIRIVVGVVLIAVGFILKNWIVGIIGLLALGTGLAGTCLLYIPLGISTCKNKPASKK